MGAWAGCDVGVATGFGRGDVGLPEVGGAGGCVEAGGRGATAAASLGARCVGVGEGVATGGLAAGGVAGGSTRRAGSAAGGDVGLAATAAWLESRATKSRICSTVGGSMTAKALAFTSRFQPWIRSSSSWLFNPSSFANS